MLTRNEKIQILKSVSIFTNTPEKILAEVATILEPIEIKAGETIFEKGDLGASMYIIIDGRVRVHDGDRTLNYLGPRDVFGEMAALDPEARVASIVTVEDTRLFHIDQDLVYALMADRIEIVRGVIHVLCERLRARVRDLAEDFKYMQQFAKVTSAAVALEAGVYQPEAIDEVAQRTDQLGQLARVFQRMVREVQAREQRLQQQVQELRIEIDQVKKERQVAEITETDYFQELQQKARELRRKAESAGGSA